MNLEVIEKEVLDGLKDFQRATVNRVFELFNTGSKRVLVGDEVGLGKTLIAKGTIARVARYHKEVLNDPEFKVVYICSNQNIASQNIKKLKIDKKVRVDNFSEARLSMQHLKVFRDKVERQKDNSYIQLIPLTPQTSFNMTSGQGTVWERALMYAILKRSNLFSKYTKQLRAIFRENAKSSWEGVSFAVEASVVECDKSSNREYLTTVLGKVDEYFKKNNEVYIEAIELLQEAERRRNNIKTLGGKNQVISKLRVAMAEISIDLINPDLVIMDEFQKFKELIDINDNSETGLLSKRFFNSNDDELGAVKVLLLSATPYKLYSTLEEISESGTDEHYREFMQVVDFLHEENEEERKAFRQDWREYSSALNSISDNGYDELLKKKCKAEDSLYKVICRTERMAVEGAESILNTEVEKGKVKVNEEDILSYVQMSNVFDDIELNENVPVEYVKSAPYIMSFMDSYKVKEKIFNYYSSNQENIDILNKKSLWVDKSKVSKYKEIPMANGRLEKLKQEALNGERLLWVPPSLPYYELRGAYKGKEDFSKTLVFSSWEMVPRAIAIMLSYEAERLTVGKIFNNLEREEINRRSYFDKNPFPPQRVVFRMKDNKASNMNILTLLIPSITLSEMFNPIECLKEDKDYISIKLEIEKEIKRKLKEIVVEEENGRVDERWYYVAPLLFDKGKRKLYEFFNRINEIDNDKNSGLSKHMQGLKDIYENLSSIKLGKQPDDLVKVLRDMVLGSPTIAMMRVLKNSSATSLIQAVKIGKIMIDKFNLEEATAIVELQYGNRSDDAHWKNVLKYCRDGNIQAVFDEYAHILVGNSGGNKDIEGTNEEITSLFEESFKTRSASYNVDTFNAFKERVIDGGSSKAIKMKANYAVGFYDTKNDDKTTQRKEAIRLGFNSPFRPFVLATTSIGQEGLDFHNYCRKIVHWNLPSNPVDLEQREGRINRFKCLAIRNNIASRFKDINFKEDVWEELFDKALLELKGEDDCELIPFWCLPSCDGAKIERIVPAYPFSKDVVKYERLMKILSLYRLSLGQARQEELMEYIIDNNFDKDKLKELFMNLSPYYKNK